MSALLNFKKDITNSCSPHTVCVTSGVLNRRESILEAEGSLPPCCSLHKKDLLQGIMTPQTHQAVGTSTVPAWDVQVCVPPEPKAGLQQLVCRVNPKSVVSSKDTFFLLRVLGVMLRSGHFRSHSVSACDFFRAKQLFPVSY